MSRAFQGDGATEWIEEQRGRRFRKLLAFIVLTFLFVSPSLYVASSISFFFAASLCLSSWLSLCMAAGGKSSGFMMRLCNERRHGDSAVSPHRLHLFLFLCSLYICLCHYQSSFLLSPSLSLFIYWGPILLFLPECQCLFTPSIFWINTTQKRLFSRHELFPMTHIQGFCLL